MYSPNKQVGIVDPALATQQQVAQQIPQAVQPMTNVPPAGSSLINPFSSQAQANAQGIYGGVDQRQNAVRASALFQRTSTPDNDEPTTYHDRLNFKGETQSQIINEADMSNSVERSKLVRNSNKEANEKIDKAIYDLKNPKMKMKESKKYIKI
jgi:hypothetical protein